MVLWLPVLRRLSGRGDALKLLPGTLVALAGVVCCTPSPREPSVQAVVGCYDLRFEDWAGLSAEDSLRLMHFLPPPRVEFSAEVFGPGHPSAGKYQVSPAPASRVSPHRITAWEFEGDSIHAGWVSPGFFAGVLVTLGVGDGDLRGHATPFTDSDSGRRATIAVVATHVACDAPPDFPLAAGQYVPRSVELVGGGKLELGLPLPDSLGLIAQEAGSRLVVPRTAAGLFAGLEGVAVGLALEGRVQRLDVEFAPSESPESVLARFEGVLGDTDASVIGQRGTATWEDRATRLELRWGDRGFYVTLWDPRLVY